MTMDLYPPLTSACVPRSSPNALFVWLRYAVDTEEFDRSLPGQLVEGEWRVQWDWRSRSTDKAAQLLERMRREMRIMAIPERDVDDAKGYSERWSHEHHKRELAALEREFSEAVTFRRCDVPWESGYAQYVCHCSICQVRVMGQTDRHMVHRYENVPRVPYRSELRSDLAFELVLTADMLCGDYEKRRHNAEVDQLESKIEARTRHELAMLGCPHARLRREA